MRSNGTSSSIGTIDEGLYSRQIYVLGMNAMHKITDSTVLLMGVDGLGIEIAKNIVLGGINTLIIYDPTPVTLSSISTQFFLREEDISKPHASACADRLSELNLYTRVKVLETEPTDELIKAATIVIMTGSPLSEALKVNEIARSNGTYFIYANTWGLFSYVFTDFGEKFTVYDTNGEEPLTGLVCSISNDEHGMVTCSDQSRHGLSDGDYVSFSEVKKMEGINNAGPFKVAVIGPYTFSIGDTRSFGNSYGDEGVFTQVKMPIDISFKSMKDSLFDPPFFIYDYSKADSCMQIHIGLQALDKFKQKYGRDPHPRDENDARIVFEMAATIPIKEDRKVELSEKIIDEIAFQSRGRIPAMCTVIGGFVAQEAFKACTGKFTPLNQIWCFDYIDALPSSSSLTKESCAPNGTRYDPQIAVFGSDFMEKVRNCKLFVIGSGAIGCELLKICALSGMGSGKDGNIVVTDMDNIEKSNLNRQLLFRNKHIGMPKSEIAAKAVEDINKDMKGKIVARVERVGEETEQIFDDSFWENITIVTNALDNLEARKYVDGRCVLYRKALIDSGTLGTKGNVQVVIPFLTESYASSHDPPEKSIPVCTLKNFPNQIEHAVEWSRDLFDSLFKDPMNNLKLYLEDEKYLGNTKKISGGQEVIMSIYNILVRERPNDFTDCIKWSRHKYEELFCNRLKQLLFNFPLDSVTSSGAPFWSLPKRAPKPEPLDLNNHYHLDFIVSASNLIANCYGIKPIGDIEYIKEAVSKIHVPNFVPKAGIKIALNDSESAQEGDINLDLDEIISKIPKPSEVAKIKITPIEFEKDDDTNFHIDFIASAGNIRAINYSIKPTDRQKVKLIAGRIIPAIATTTAVVSGLSILEAYKILDDKKKLDDYKNSFTNLALPFFGFSDPIGAPCGKYYDKTFTMWDRFEVDGNISIQELVSYFEKEYELFISMLSCGTTLIFAPFLNRRKSEDRSNIPIYKTIENIRKKPIPKHVKKLVLDAIASEKSDKDVDIPYILVTLNRD